MRSLQIPTGFIRADGSIPFTGPESMGSHKLTSLANGTASSDAAAFGQIGDAVVLEVAHTTSYQLLNTDFGKKHSNRGAGGPIIITLVDPSTMTGPSWDPTVTPLKPIRIECVTAQDLKVLNFDGSTLLYLGSVKQTVAGGFARAIQGAQGPSPGSVAVGAMLTIWWKKLAIGWFAEVTGDWKPDA